MSSESTKQYLREMMHFLRDKMRSSGISGEVIVRRHEIAEIARRFGMDQEEAD